MPSLFIEIDGSYLAGGGQILRTACALSAVTKRPCRVFNIRYGRPDPGLMAEHLLVIQALAQLCQGRLEGDFLGSKEIKFYPGDIYKEQIFINIPTAASITLILQGLIPIALFAPRPVKITFNGGATDTFFSPTIDYFRYVFLNILEKINTKIEINILKRGYFPEGGAQVEAKIYPAKLNPLNLTETGKLNKIFILSGASDNLKKEKVSERQAAGVRGVLGTLDLPTEEFIEYYPTQNPGSQICLIVDYENTAIGADNLGKMGKRAEDIGRETALALLKEERSNACLDKYSSDQILPYMAFVEDKSFVTVSEVTNRCKTNIWVIEKFIDGKFEIKNNLIIWNSNQEWKLYLQNILGSVRE